MTLKALTRKQSMIVAAVVAAGWMVAAAAPAMAGDLWCVTASTSQPAGADAGKDLAKKAKDACKDRAADLVLVFGKPWPKADETAAFLTAMGEQFDKKIIYGCTWHRGAAINEQTDKGVAAVMVLGGGFKVSATKMDGADGPKKKDYVSGMAMAEELKPAFDTAAGKGRLIMLLGASNGLWSDKMVNGMTKKLGSDVTFWGGNTVDTNGGEYFQGEFVQHATIAVLVTGDFHCGSGMAESKEMALKKPNTAEGLAESAGEAMKAAGVDKKADVLAVLMCSCCSRSLSGLPGVELKAITSVTSAPVIGFNGEGEIGHEATGKPPANRAEKISVCALHKGAPPASQPAAAR